MLLIAGCTPGVYQSKPVDGPPAIVPAGLINLPDAIPRDEVPCGGCARPYVIDGVRYQPLASNLGYRERGHASWYGSAFHGNPNARALQVKVLAAGVEPVEIFAVEVNGRRLHRVRVGPVTEDIETLMIARLKDLGLYSPAKDTP